MAELEDWKGLDYDLLMERYPFLKTKIDLRAIAYPIKIMMGFKKRAVVFSKIHEFLDELKESYKKMLADELNPGYTHLLDMDKDFLDLLRLGLSIRRISYKGALRMKQKADTILSKMCISSYL